MYKTVLLIELVFALDNKNLLPQACLELVYSIHVYPY